jgi:hypothetical protein
MPRKELEAIAAEIRELALAVDRIMAGRSMEVVLHALSLAVASSLASINPDSRTSALARIAYTASEYLDDMVGQ